MNKEEIKQEPNDGLIARILGGTPTILQKVFFILMAFSLILWPLGCYVSIFFFDAPVRSDVDKLCRYGMPLTSAIPSNIMVSSSTLLILFTYCLPFMSLRYKESFCKQ